jgi:hypothetical protein
LGCFNYRKPGYFVNSKTLFNLRRYLDSHNTDISSFIIDFRIWSFGSLYASLNPTDVASHVTETLSSNFAMLIILCCALACVK